jgi:hypothetical protein
MVGQRSACPRVPSAVPCQICLWLCLVLAACRGLAPGLAAEPDLVRQLRARHVDPASVIIPWQLNDEMRSWAHQHVSDQLPTDQRLDRLLAVLMGQEGLDLTYQVGATGTAEEVFASRHANCLSFTSLFVGMARELGVDAFYLDVGDVEKFEREGSLVVESGHITAGFGSGSLLRILEFTPIARPNYRQLHRISDLTAIALFYSNRGAELLRKSQERDALVWLHESVGLDPELARGWINLGVALRRTGDPAYQNLAALLFAAGRAREGDELMALSGKLDIRNPFNFLSLGDVALSHGRFEEARRFYRKAQHLEGAGAEAEAALGQLALAKGDKREARRWFRKAAAHDGANERVKRLAAQLGEATGART